MILAPTISIATSVERSISHTTWRFGSRQFLSVVKCTKVDTRADFVSAFARGAPDAGSSTAITCAPALLVLLSPRQFACFTKCTSKLGSSCRRRATPSHFALTASAPANRDGLRWSKRNRRSSTEECRPVRRGTPACRRRNLKARPGDRNTLHIQSKRSSQRLLAVHPKTLSCQIRILWLPGTHTLKYRSR